MSQRLSMVELFDGDMLVCGAKRFDPLGVVVRAATRGIKNAFNASLSTHTSIAFEYLGAMRSVGMTGRFVDDVRGKNKNGIYILPIEKEHVLSVRRHPALQLPYAQSHLRAVVNRDIVNDDEYDYRVWGDYPAHFIGDHIGKHYCSEKVYLWTRYAVQYPSIYRVRVSPADLQHCGCGWHTIWSKA